MSVDHHKKHHHHHHHHHLNPSSRLLSVSLQCCAELIVCLKQLSPKLAGKNKIPEEEK